MTKKSRRRDGGEVRQKPRGVKSRRPKHWHKPELFDLPDVGSGADPAAGEPRPIHARDHRGKRRFGGDAA